MNSILSAEPTDSITGFGEWGPFKEWRTVAHKVYW